MAKWGRIDVLIANAGILRDKSFAKMELGDFDAVVDVHLMGAVNTAQGGVGDHARRRTTAASWSPPLPPASTAISARANYGAAKLSLVGLMNTLKLEGAKNNIRVNAISPVAATRMTEAMMPPEMLASSGPEHVTPGVVYLATRRSADRRDPAQPAPACSLSAQIVETEGGLNLGAAASAENVRDHWTQITDPKGAEAYLRRGWPDAKILRKSST